MRPGAGVFLLGLLAAVCARPGRAEWGRQARPTGIGVLLGSTFGLSAKRWVDGSTALDLGLGAAGRDFSFHADLLTHLEGRLGDQAVPLYLGLGARIANERRTLVGVRFVGGAYRFLPPHPIEVFAELAPLLRVAPSFGAGLDLGLGLRYYFGKV